MIYVMSDLHGCYKEYLEALECIGFSDEDQLYVLGDIVDRGEEPIKLLQDMMMRHNVFPLIGNHEYMALTVLNRLSVEISKDNAESCLSEEDIENYYRWVQDGGDVTCNQFQALSREDQQDILEYLEEFTLYEEVQVNGKEYILIHAGLEPFDVHKALETYKIEEIVFKSVDYQNMYFKDKYVVSGHRPTFTIDEDYKGKIIEINNHLAIDCGCVYGYALGVLCLDTLEKWYVEK